MFKIGIISDTHNFLDASRHVAMFVTIKDFDIYNLAAFTMR